MRFACSLTLNITSQNIPYEKIPTRLLGYVRQNSDVPDSAERVIELTLRSLPLLFPLVMFIMLLVHCMVTNFLQIKAQVCDVPNPCDLLFISTVQAWGLQRVAANPCSQQSERPLKTR